MAKLTFPKHLDFQPRRRIPYCAPTTLVKRLDALTQSELDSMPMRQLGDTLLQARRTMWEVQYRWPVGHELKAKTKKALEQGLAALDKAKRYRDNLAKDYLALVRRRKPADGQ